MTPATVFASAFPFAAVFAGVWLRYDLGLALVVLGGMAYLDLGLLPLLNRRDEDKSV